MPFDIDDRFAHVETQHQRRDRRLVAAWLFGICAMLLVMIGLGGATRLTGSGLSIMEWAPIMGTLPPLSDAEWQRLFHLYQAIPQYSLVNAGFGLDGFKHIFLLEYLHRLWGRLIGLGFALPLLVFVWRRAIGRALWLRLAGLFVLGGMQGAVGWFMVASGFTGDSVSVSAYRLVAHLTLALTLYAAILWTALGVLRPRLSAVGTDVRAGLGLQRWLTVSCAMVAVTIVAGGFVAGLHAGFVYNTYPLMDGHLIPSSYAALQPFARNLTENLAAVQFDHRVLATLTALVVTATAWAGLRPSVPGPVRAAALAMGVAVGLQYALGVATLLWVVPVTLGTMHQVSAVLLLSATLVACHLARRAG